MDAEEGGTEREGRRGAVAAQRRQTGRRKREAKREGEMEGRDDEQAERREWRGWERRCRSLRKRRGLGRGTAANAAGTAGEDGRGEGGR